MYVKIFCTKSLSAWHTKEYDLVQAQPAQTQKFSSIFIETSKDLSPHSQTPARTSLLLRCLFFKAFSSRSSITALNSSKSTSPAPNQSDASFSWRKRSWPNYFHLHCHPCPAWWSSTAHWRTLGWSPEQQVFTRYQNKKQGQVPFEKILPLSNKFWPKKTTSETNLAVVRVAGGEGVQEALVELASDEHLGKYRSRSLSPWNICKVSVPKWNIPGVTLWRAG